jgi:adenosylcobinamide-GDP ribazoletransferase
MRALFAAVQFLTILPIPGGHKFSDADWARTTAWYPMVGLVMGIILVGLDWVFRQLWSDGVVAALLVLAWVVLTGALHLDGFVDCCDALLVPASRERRLDILWDVHVGAFGVVGVLLLLLVKYAALAALPSVIRPSALLLMPTLGRWAMTGAVLLFPYARSGPGLGQRAKSGAGKGQLAAASATGLLVAGLAGWWSLGWAVVLLVLLTVATVVGLSRWVTSRIGGLTGDVYGTICEVVEVVILLSLAALVRGNVLA